MPQIALTRSRKWTLIAASMIAVLPLGLILLTAILAFVLGCEINEAAPQTCNVLGFELGPTLEGFFAAGSLGLVLIPIVLVLIPVWFLVEAAVWMWRRQQGRRREKQNDDAINT